MTPRACDSKITDMVLKFLRSQDSRIAAGFAALAMLLVFVAGCSDAPLITRQANRLVLSELFSTTE